jgi:hypothetical protein
MRPASLLAVLALMAGLGLLCTDDPAGAQDPAGWADVKGQIVWGGNGLPEVKTLNVDKDQGHCLSRGPIPSEEWVINKDSKGVRWVVVWLAPENADQKLPVHPNLQAVPKAEVLVDQPCCKFEPHVVALRQGQVVAVKNSAPITHNVNWAGIRNRGDNKILAPGAEVKIDDLKASPFPVQVQCNIHPWMKGWVRIFDHPYFAITDENGRFELKNAPAGKYRLVVWHEVGFHNGDKTGVPIQIKPGAANDLGKVEYKPPKP